MIDINKIDAACKDALLEKAKNEIVCDVSGYYYFAPQSRGLISELQLLIIAEKLSIVNAPLDAEINEFFDNKLDKEQS